MWRGLPNTRSRLMRSASTRKVVPLALAASSTEPRVQDFPLGDRLIS